MEQVDEAFIQPIEFRPKQKQEETGDEFPVIDLCNSDKERLVSEIGDACAKWGFFQVINHGVPLDLKETMEKVAKEFCHQPIEQKKKVARDELNPMGFYESEHTKNVRDWKNVFDFSVQDPTFIPATLHPDDTELRTLTNQWPTHPPRFREICEEYTREVEKLAFKLLELVSLSLGLPEKRLTCYFKEQTSFARINHYPPCPSPHLALGVGPHKDGGALSVLSQDDVGGLQVKRKCDGEWILVKPTPNAYIINVGNAMQVWSNDAYESVEHRVVVNSLKERFSIPFFFLPAYYVDVKPLEELLNDKNPAKYKPFNWGKFYASRKRSNYKKSDKENIQIENFKAKS
ncbi:hypothetical protein ACFE04_021788 [Oxalis oulophora]